MNLGNSLTVALQIKSISQSEFAKTMQVAPQQIYSWRTSEEWKVSTLIRVAKALDYSLDAFVDLCNYEVEKQTTTSLKKR